MSIDTGDHPLIAQKPYQLPLKHSQWICEEFKMLEKAKIILRSVSAWSSLIIVVPKKPNKVKYLRHVCA